MGIVYTFSQLYELRRFSLLFKEFPFKSKQIYTDIKNVMPLPPALAARLAKRGIISKKSAQQAKPQEEEVFAESYDDHEDNNSKSNQDTFEKVKYLGYPCCPNKWNVYHECSLYCQNHWSNRRSNGPDPDSEYAAKYKAMMSKFGPLPENWTEKWDPGCQRHYYWCSKTGFLTLRLSKSLSVTTDDFIFDR